MSADYDTDATLDGLKRGGIVKSDIDIEHESPLAAEKLVELLDYSPDQIMVVDPDGVILYVNRACEKHYGMTKDRLIGNKSVGTPAFDYNPHVRYEVIKNRCRITQIQQASNGMLLLTTGTPVFDERGEIQYILYNCRDETIDVSEGPALRSFRLAENFSERKEFNFITQNKIMKEMLAYIERISPMDSTILLMGSSGTGKSLLAKYIHETSQRKKERFININCASIPEALLESELFGYRPGAFSGASKSGKKGLLELANNGTVFLDEIGELPLSLQPKLLRVLQDGCFFAVGDIQEKKVNCRIIAATNQNLKEMVRNKTFRADLYYRLNVIEIKIPPLKERRDDIILLTNYFLSKKELKYHTISHIVSPEAMSLLQSHPWPGNIRQLENAIERLVISVPEQDIKAEHLEFLRDFEEDDFDEVSLPSGMAYEDFIEQIEARVTRDAYVKYGSIRKMAAALQLSESKAARLVRKYC